MDAGLSRYKPNDIGLALIALIASFASSFSVLLVVKLYIEVRSASECTSSGLVAFWLTFSPDSVISA